MREDQALRFWSDDREFDAPHTFHTAALYSFAGAGALLAGNFILFGHVAKEFMPFDSAVLAWIGAASGLILLCVMTPLFMTLPSVRVDRTGVAKSLLGAEWGIRFDQVERAVFRKGLWSGLTLVTASGRRLYFSAESRNWPLLLAHLARKCPAIGHAARDAVRDGVIQKEQAENNSLLERLETAAAASGIFLSWLIDKVLVQAVCILTALAYAVWKGYRHFVLASAPLRLWVTDAGLTTSRDMNEQTIPPSAVEEITLRYGLRKTLGGKPDLSVSGTGFEFSFQAEGLSVAPYLLFIALAQAFPHARAVIER